MDIKQNDFFCFLVLQKINNGVRFFQCVQSTPLFKNALDSITPLF